MKENDMPRYIDADHIDYTVTMVGRDEYAGHRAVAFESDIDAMPTADVVPRAEVDSLHHLLKDAWKRIEELDELCGELQNAKAEVAKEIFAEIDKVYDECIYINPLTNIGSLQVIKFEQMLAELKKKYTEE
jgi:hypothetical protein